MANKAGILNVIIGAKISDFLTKMQVVERRTGRTSKKVGTSVNLLNTAVTGAFVAMAASALRASTQFSMSMTKIETLVGIARGEVDKMRDSVKRMAGDVGRDPEELAQGMFFITSAGLRGADAMEALEFAAKGAAIGLGETKDIADATTSIMNAYGSEVYTAAEATELLLKTVRFGKVEAETLAPTLGRVIPVAQALGITMEEVGANIATVTRVGLGAEEAVVTLRGIMNTFVKPSAEANAELERMGTNMDSLRLMIKEKGLLATLLHLKDLFGDNVEAMGKVIPNVRALSNFLATTGKQMDDYTDILAGMNEKTNLVGEAMDRVSEEAGFKWEKMMARAKVVSLEFGDALVTVAEGYADLTAAATAFGMRNNIFDDDSNVSKPKIGTQTVGFNGKVTDPFKDYTEQDQEAFNKAFTTTAKVIAKVNKETTSLNKTNQDAKELEVKLMDVAGIRTMRLAETRREVENLENSEEELAIDQGENIKLTEIQTEKVNKFGVALMKAGFHVQEFAQTFQDDYGFALQFVGNQLSQLDSLFYQFHTNRMADIEALERKELEAYKARYEGAAGYEQGLENLQDQQTERRNRAQQEFAQKQKAVATFSAVVLGAQATLQALASMPFPASAIAAGIIGTMVAGQVAAINGAQIPGFAGGVIGSPNGMALVGERGPEMVRLPAGANVYNASASRSMGGGLYTSVDREQFVIWTGEGGKHHSFRRAGR